MSKRWQTLQISTDFLTIFCPEHNVWHKFTDQSLDRNDTGNSLNKIVPLIKSKWNHLMDVLIIIDKQ
ncbi:hypothetical protein GJU39_07555 [Pedobacter petrophilus]|uniref:Uncharacterized protein n=1 Tax=Pedobacter petrophilus TaxID=1908241 RepID=A0A7K0FWG6_9SPHI|nr:hypothetical protein [Pedobacter petrophilus]MRX75943.1 hypothetical protein [Pedobacter petrophilus]